MNYNQMKYVICLAEQGSFSKAAKELFITQPSLSNQIHQLEEELGISLFTRSYHSLKLSEAGHDFVLYSKRILNEIDNLQNLMQSYSSYTHGKLNIGIFSTGGYLGIPDAIMTFQKLYPKIDIHLSITNSPQLIDWLLTQEIDVAILNTNENILKTNDFQYDFLTEENYTAIVPVFHPLHTHSCLSIEDLKNQKIILPQTDTIIRSALLNILADEKEAPSFSSFSNQIEGCIQMAISGFGIAIVPYSTARKLKNEKVSIIPIIPPIQNKVYLGMLKSTYPGSIADEFFTYIKTQFR